MAIMGFITEILQRIPGDMKRSNMIILLFILALLLTGCSGRAEAPIAEPEATAVQTEIAPEATSAPAEAKDTAPAEPEPTSEPVKAKELSLTYDAKEQTFRVTDSNNNAYTSAVTFPAVEAHKSNLGFIVSDGR